MTAAKSKQLGTTRARAKTATASVLSPAADSGTPALTPLEYKLVQARLTTHSLVAAAKACDISWSTAWRHWQRPEVQAAFNEASRELHDAALRRLQGLTQKAIDVLEQSLRAPSRATRLTAARYILAQAAKASELLDIDARLKAIEGTK